jgi:hypothetical protein
VGAELFDEGGGYLQAQLALLIDADGFVAAGLARLPISGQKHPRRIPPIAPVLFGDLGGGQVVAGAPQPLPTDRHRRVPRRQRVLAAASRWRNTASRRVLANRSAALRYPRQRRSPDRRSWSLDSGSRSPGRSAHRSAKTATAAPRSLTWAARPRIPNWY